LLITRLDAVTFEGRILAGDYKGTVHTIPRMPVPSIEGDLPWILTRYQLPVRPCFAMTVNKSQGQTLGVVGVNLQVSPFAHGQLNVAMSRGTDAGSITVLQVSLRVATVTRWHCVPYTLCSSLTLVLLARWSRHLRLVNDKGIVW
jgi:hypothetical protein